MIKWLLAFINTLTLMLLILYFSISLPTFTMPFYNYAYNKNGTHELIGISQYDLERVTRLLIDYMRGNIDNLDIVVQIHGVSRPFFSEIEIAHMIDVQDLFMIGFIIRNIALVLFLATLLSGFLYKQGPVLKEYAQSFIAGTIILLSFGGALITIILTNFERSFIIFHEIFFDNDLWILDPSVDLLINIVPQQFFVDLFIVIVCIFLLVSIVIFLFCVIYLKSIKRHSINDVQGANIK
ncbi:MAG: TIGR01906 family membrane protein [Defluviitaleaceae bacterium]|nr:TIGR01906 family membrane protein [Defluviitaleaceae bacterium]